MKALHRNFNGLRWSDKIGHCGCPLALDTYWACTDMKCLYCPAHWDAKFSKCGFNVPDYITHSVRESDLRALWLIALNGYGGCLEDTDAAKSTQFTEYIFSKKFVQLGYKTDPFIDKEKEFKITLAMMRFFHYQYQPTMISTKATWWATDDRYAQVLAANPDLWHVKISISSLDVEQSSKLEPGVPSPDERLDAIEALSSLGVPVTLWIRPFIPGHSDDTVDELVERAAAAGAQAVSIEWLNLQRNPKDALMGRYNEISEVLGYPILNYYQDGSPTGRPMRLTNTLKRPTMERIRDLSRGLGMTFTVSDVHNKDLSDAMKNCCGSPNAERFVHSSHTCAVLSRLHDVSFSCLDPDELRTIFGLHPILESGAISCDSKKKSKHKDDSIFDFIERQWDDLEGGDSGTTAIHRLYGDELAPASIDKFGHRVYRRGGLDS